jgi:hypothetical protein
MSGHYSHDPLLREAFEAGQQFERERMTQLHVAMPAALEESDRERMQRKSGSNCVGRLF